MIGSEDELGISTTVIDNTDPDDNDIIDFEDISPGEEDRIEEELLKEEEKKMSTSTPFGSPISNPSPTTTTGLPFGAPSTQQQQSSWNSGPFGINNNQNNYTPPSSSIWGNNTSNNNSGWGWGSNNNSPGWSWGSNNNNNSFNAFNNSSSGSGWSWGGSGGINNNAKPGNIQTISKKLVFCSFIDTIVCSLSNSFMNGRLAVINRSPSDLTDIYVRKEVLFKMSKITAERVYVIIPSEVIRGWICNTSLTEKRPDDQYKDMSGIVNYLRMCLMTFMKYSIPDRKYCQFLVSSSNEIKCISSIVNQEIDKINKLEKQNYTKSDVVFLGANGGANGYGSLDKMVADTCNIDFLDTNILLNY